MAAAVRLRRLDLTSIGRLHGETPSEEIILPVSRIDQVEKERATIWENGQPLPGFVTLIRKVNGETLYVGETMDQVLEAIQDA